MKNMDIRQAARTAGVFLWQIAEELNITDSTFSRKLRTELEAKEKEKIFQIIEDISQTN